jgi:hypothetical protein
MRILLTLLLLNPFLVVGQNFSRTLPELLSVSTDVVEIKQRSFNRGLFPSRWKSYYQYNNGKLKQQVNHFKNELRMDETYEYTESENILRVKKSYTNKEDYSLTVSHFDSFGRLVKYELYFDQDTLNPEIKSNNFVYDSSDRIISFQRTKYFQNSRSQTDCYGLGYKNNKLTEISIRGSCNTISHKDQLEYLSEKSVFRTIDHMDPNVVVVGGRSEQGIQRYLYKLDKQGNWVKQYYVKSNGRKILEIKRRIKYAAHNN